MFRSGQIYLLLLREKAEKGIVIYIFLPAPVQKNKNKTKTTWAVSVNEKPNTFINLPGMKKKWHLGFWSLRSLFSTVCASVGPQNFGDKQDHLIDTVGFYKSFWSSMLHKCIFKLHMYFKRHHQGLLLNTWFISQWGIIWFKTAT